MTVSPMVVAAAALLVAWSLQLYGAEPLPRNISAHVLCDLCDVSVDGLARRERITQTPHPPDISSPSGVDTL